MTKEKKSKVWEISLLSVFGAIWLFGFILAILGMVAFNAPVATKTTHYIKLKNHLLHS